MDNLTNEQFFTEKFDNNFRSIKSEIVKEGIFNRFWRMRPMVGADYEKQAARILLVLESYYFDQEDQDNGSVFTNADYWYLKEGAILIPKISEKNVNMHEDWICNPTKGPYPNIFRSLCALRGGDFESQCRSIAIYNYFLRPAFNNNGRKGFRDNNYCKEIDRNVAYEAFCGIVDTLKPNIVVFLTQFSYDTFQKYSKSFENVKIEYTQHPSRRWHNYLYWENYGDIFKNKDKFERIIADSLEKRYDQIPIIDEIKDEIRKITNENWGTWGGWLLCIKLDDVGIESCFECVDNNPFGIFKIFISTKNKEVYEKYSDIINEKYPDKTSTKQGEKVVLIVEEIQEKYKDMILERLQYHYENLKNIVEKTS